MPVPNDCRGLAEWQNQDSQRLRRVRSGQYPASRCVLMAALANSGDRDRYSGPAIGEQPHDYDDDRGGQHVMLRFPVVHGQEGLFGLGGAL
jgi:hypothetical protein